MPGAAEALTPTPESVRFAAHVERYLDELARQRFAAEEAVAAVVLELYDWDLDAVRRDGVHWVELAPVELFREPPAYGQPRGLACQWPRP